MEHRRVLQEVQVSAVLDHDHPAASIRGRRYERVGEGFQGARGRSGSHAPYLARTRHDTVTAT